MPIRSGQKAILAGDNSLNPPLEFLGDTALVRPGDRVVSSADGGVFPADLLVGQVALGTDERLRVRLAADYQRLEFLRVLRSQEHEAIPDPDGLLAPDAEFFGPAAINPVPLQSVEANDG